MKKVYILVSFLFFVTLFIIELYYFNSDYYFYYTDSIAPSDTLLSKTNSEESYRKYCINNKENPICKKLNTDFFYDYFYGECMAVKENEESYCDSLDSKENVIFCKNNLIVLNALTTGNRNLCVYSLIDKIEVGGKKLGHTEKENDSFCQGIVDLSKNLSEESVLKFTMDYFGDKRFLVRVKGIAYQKGDYCYEGSGIDDRIKCLIYTKSLDCSRLKDKEYLYQLIGGTNHFYDN